MSVANFHFLESILDRFQHVASALPDFRRSSNTRYAVFDAAACALAAVLFQSPSFLNFQRRILNESFRSNCHPLFGVDRVPCDNHIRNLLDGRDPAAFHDLFPLWLHTLRDHGTLAPFLRLDGHLLVALVGIQFHCSDSIHCDQCSARHVGKHKRKQYFHTMLSATVVADGHNRVLPLMPEFVQPQHNPAASQPDLTEQQRKQGCECNAAKRWLDSNLPALLPRQPVLLGDDLYRCQPVCQRVLDRGADFLFVCKANSHKISYKTLPDRHI